MSGFTPNDDALVEEMGLSLLDADLIFDRYFCTSSSLCGITVIFYLFATNILSCVMLVFLLLHMLFACQPGKNNTLPQNRDLRPAGKQKTKSHTYAA